MAKLAGHTWPKEAHMRHALLVLGLACLAACGGEDLDPSSSSAWIQTCLAPGEPICMFEPSDCKALNDEATCYLCECGWQKGWASKFMGCVHGPGRPCGEWRYWTVQGDCSMQLEPCTWP